MTRLFLDHSDAASIAEEVEAVLVLVRRARRFTTKSESRLGMEADRAVHEAGERLDRLLARLGKP